MGKAFTSLTVVLWLALAGSWASAEEQLHGKELRHDDAEIRRYTDENVPKSPGKPLPPTKEAAAQIVSILEKGDRYEAERSAWVLGDWPAAGNASALLRACESKWPEIRAQAASSLGLQCEVISEQDRARAIRQLAGMLEDADPRVIASSLQALGLLDTDPAIEAVGRFTKSKDKQLALAATRALGNIGDAKGFQYLRATLASDDKDLACAAIEATGKLGNPALSQHLLRKLESESVSEQVAAIRAILNLKAKNEVPRLNALLRHKRGPVRREALAGIVELAGASYEQQYLDHTKDPDHTVRRVAARAIGRFRLVNGLPHLYALFADGHFYVREDAVDSMVAIGNEAAIQLCAKGLTGKTGTVRECSSQTLGRLKSDANLQAHIAILKDEFLPAREWAAWSLGEIGRKEASDALFACAFPPEDKPVAYKRDDYVRYMEARSCAILSLGKLGYTKAFDKFHWLVPQKPTPSFAGQPTLLRGAAVRSMGMLKDTGGLGILNSRMNDMYGMTPEDPDLRFEAAIAMGRIGAKGSISILTRHLNQKDETDRIRVGCQWSLWQITGQKPALELPPRVYPVADYFVRYLKRRPKK